jgi:transposase InsO family protein
MQTVSMDLYKLKGIHYLVMCDRYSFFCWVLNLTTLSTVTVIKIINGWFKILGYPQYIHSDNGPQYNSREFKGYCSDHFITRLNFSPLHAQSNGLAEAAVKSVKYLLIKSDTFADFESRLYKMQAVPSSGKTNSPAELFYKHSFRTKLPTLAHFYDPLKTATGENKFVVGQGVRLQNDKTKRCDDTGTVLVI